MKDSTLCAQCRVGDHRNHNEDGCSNDNNFNADCACPVEYESWKAFVAELTAPAEPLQPTGEQESADKFHCENCERDFTESPHATDDGYWLCDPCWKGLQ